jgi:hypothetical protein
MNIICRGRCEGKTTELIKLAHDDGGTIVCLSQDEAYRISVTAEKMKMNISYPITFNEFIGGRFYKPGIKSFYIDNAELLIQKMARNIPVKAITMSLGDGKYDNSETEVEPSTNPNGNLISPIVDIVESPNISTGIVKTMTRRNRHGKR